MTSVTVELSGLCRTLEAEGHVQRFHAVWLRDNAQNPQTRAPDNDQRPIALRDIPVDKTIDRVRLQDGRLEVRFEPEGRAVAYDVGWLWSHACDKPASVQRGWTTPNVLEWDAGLMVNVPIGDFAELWRDELALRHWLEQVNSHGFGKVTKGPLDDGALFHIANFFGHVRETNHGRHCEMRVAANPTKLAFTGLGLQAHTDNPYRDPAPTVQVLYGL